jgi:hypothetical protein
MKSFILILVLFGFYGCAALAPKVYTYPVDIVKAKVSWDNTIKVLEDKCLNTVGVRVDPALSPEGKNFRYFCEVRKFPDTKDKKSLFTDPYFGYKWRTEGGSGSHISSFVEDHYLKKNGIESIWKEQFAYVSWMNSFILKNGYTLLTLGKREPWAITKFQGDPSYVMRIEGFSANPNPTLDEIHGKKVDVPLASLESIIAQYKKYVKANHAKEKRIQEAHNQGVYRSRARDKARRRSENRRQNSAWDQDFINYRNKMLGTGSTQRKPIQNRQQNFNRRNQTIKQKSNRGNSNNYKRTNNVQVPRQEKRCALPRYGKFDTSGATLSAAEKERRFEKTIEHMSAECKAKARRSHERYKGNRSYPGSGKGK